MSAIDWFAKIYDLPASVRNPLLSAGVPRVIPIASGLSIRVREVDEEHAVTTMPFSRRARNHVGSIYIGAMLVQAEVTMATLVVMRCRPPAFRVLVKKSEAEFHARATSTIRATCRPDAEERAAIERCVALAPGEKGEAWATVRMEAKGSLVCTMRFLVAVKRKA